MAKAKFSRIVPIKEVIDQHLTLHFFSFVDSVFGTSVHVSATLNDTSERVIFTTGSAAIVALFKEFEAEDDVAGLQIVVRERGKSYSIENLDED